MNTTHKSRLLAVRWALTLLLQPLVAQAVVPFSVADNLSFPITDSLVASPVGDRIAWVFDERGVRNVWVAEGPTWAARSLTQFTRDEGKPIGELAFSADGSTLVFVRNADEGNWPSPGGVRANAASLPEPPHVEIWAAEFRGGKAHEVAEGDAPVLSPDGQRVVFLKDGQAHVVATRGVPKPARLFFARGTTRDLAWSPDGRTLAFVSDRGSHSLLGLFTTASDPIRWASVAASQIAEPRWSPDGKRLAFVRLPGRGGPMQPRVGRQPQPFSLWVADATSGEAHLVWQSPKTIAGSISDSLGEANLLWAAGDRLVFTAHFDGWPHLYSIAASGGEPTLLTPGSFEVEYVAPSRDRRTVVYNANSGPDPADDDRRHLFRVSVDHADAQLLTPGRGIEWNPAVTGGGTVAFIRSGTKESPLPAVMPLAGGSPHVLAADRVPANFPGASYAEPQRVVFQASDGTVVHGQLFDHGGGATRQRPAMIFVHGGPPRQMLLGFHYMPYYARDYAMNQFLASRGFVVLSVNYRLGIGYGDAFSHPIGAGMEGASEYLDVLAGASYLQALPQVDARRIGIWGGSYGGYLTALALARNSDLFAAGVDLHGVHNWLTASEQEGDFGGPLWNKYQRPPDLDKAVELAWASSPVADADKWRSPVLFIHGDDDLNVDVDQTVDVIERLHARDVRLQELILPNERHEWLLYSSWLRVATATADFLSRELRVNDVTAR